MSNEEMFVLEDKFFKELVSHIIKTENIGEVTHINLRWDGKTICAKKALLTYCMDRAKDEIKHTKEYNDKLLLKVTEIAKQYKWVKDKKKYSRCGKWIKETIGEKNE